MHEVDTPDPPTRMNSCGHFVVADKSINKIQLAKVTIVIVNSV